MYQTNFTFHNSRCLCTKCLYINQIKLYLCFEKFYDFYLRLMAVFRHPPPPIIGYFPLNPKREFQSLTNSVQLPNNYILQNFSHLRNICNIKSYSDNDLNVTTLKQQDLYKF
jgi:hypothetical protein